MNILKTAIIASSLGLCLTLTGCGSLIKVHRLDVQQGNIISKDALAKIHKGMSEGSVRTALGDPVLTNIFNENNLEYVYTWQPGYGKFTEKRITVYFHNGKMTHYTQSK
jgi:outer membrane protein assembly factor BamE